MLSLLKLLLHVLFPWADSLLISTFPHFFCFVCNHKETNLPSSYIYSYLIHQALCVCLTTPTLSLFQLATLLSARTITRVEFSAIVRNECVWCFSEDAATRCCSVVQAGACSLFLSITNPMLYAQVSSPACTNYVSGAWGKHSRDESRNLHARRRFVACCAGGRHGIAFNPSQHQTRCQLVHCGKVIDRTKRVRISVLSFVLCVQFSNKW